MAKISIATAKRRIIFAADEGVREVFIAEANRVVRNTPVVTGTTVANWVVGLGRKSRKKPNLRKRDPSASSVRADIEAKVRGKPVRKKTFFTNSVPWMRTLEFGKGKRAPKAIVRRVRAAHRRIVNEAAAKVRRKAESIR